MLRWLRTIDWAALVGSALVLAFFVLVIAPIAENQQQQASGPSQANQESLQEQAEETTADWTVVLGVFTGVLALIGGIQGYLIWQQIKLGRDEFEATNVPALKVRFVREEGDGAEITVINEGTGAARFVAARAALFALNATDPLPSPHDLPARSAFTLRSRFNPSDADRFVVTELDDAFSAGFGVPVYVFGWIAYDTISPNPTRRTTYFARNISPHQAVTAPGPVEASDWNFIQ